MEGRGLPLKGSLGAQLSFEMRMCFDRKLRGKPRVYQSELKMSTKGRFMHNLESMTRQKSFSLVILEKPKLWWLGEGVKFIVCLNKWLDQLKFSRGTKEEKSGQERTGGVWLV